MENFVFLCNLHRTSAMLFDWSVQRNKGILQKCNRTRLGIFIFKDQPPTAPYKTVVLQLPLWWPYYWGTELNLNFPAKLDLKITLSMKTPRHTGQESLMGPAERKSSGVGVGIWISLNWFLVVVIKRKSYS